MHWLIINGELVLYGLVGAMGWELDEFTARDVLEALMVMDGDVTVRINSAGGIASEGLAIYNALRMHAQRNGVKINVVVDGVAISAASLIAMAGDMIVMNAGTQMMIHDPSTMTSGTADEQRRSADVLDKMADQYAAIYAERSGMSVEAARAIMKAETWYTPEEAVAAGFATEVGATTAMAAAIFDYRLFQKAPAPLMQLATASASLFSPKAARAALNPKETSMTLEQLIAMLAARYGKAADDVKMWLNQAIMAGIELAVLAGLVKDTPNMEAGQSAVRGHLATMLGANPQPNPTNPNPTNPAPQTTMSATDMREVMTRAQQAGLDLATTNTLMVMPNKEAAFVAIIDKIAEMRGTNRSPSPPALVTEDARDRFRQGAVQGLMAKVGLTGGQRNEFSGLTLAELARESLMVAGNADARRMDRMLMIGTAFTGGGITMIGGAHATSDFAFILQNVAQKSVLKGFQEAEETYQLWTSKGQASDFKPMARVDLGLFPLLEEVKENAEFKYGTIGDRGTTVLITTVGKLIAISRQAIINDDLGILGNLPVKIGRAAKRTVGNAAYTILNSNPTMADTVALFHATHANLAASGAAPSEATFKAAYNAMASQKDADAIATALNITPKYFLSGVYKFEAEQLLNSVGSLDNQKNAGVTNPVRGLVTPITDRRISGNSWFFAADPNQFDTVEITYLDGIEEPVVETKDGWSVDGTEMKVRLDFGANLLDFRGLYKNPGP